MWSNTTQLTFSLAPTNDNVVYCYPCGGAFGDPYDEVTIKKGLFPVYHFGGTNDRWSNEIFFKYSKEHGTWYLFKIIDKGWNVSNLGNVDSVIKTKKDFGIVPFVKYNPTATTDALLQFGQTIIFSALPLPIFSHRLTGY